MPLPGSGRTRERWAALAGLAEEDLSLARLAEGHADAVAILTELDGPPPEPGSRWGVWAAHPPGPKLEARRSGDGWRLHGTKRYCSGARTCTHALVTADAPDGRRLFAVTAEDFTPVPGTWPATGMVGSDTLDVHFDDARARPVGGPGAYVERPGFAYGGAGVAACWYGGTRAVGRTLLSTAAQRDVGPHALAHLGAVDIALCTVRDALDGAAVANGPASRGDLRPAPRPGAARLRLAAGHARRGARGRSRAAGRIRLSRTARDQPASGRHTWMMPPEWIATTRVGRAHEARKRRYNEEVARMPRGSSPKRERQYEHIKDSSKQRGASTARAEEIAARTVNKERARSGEAKTTSRSSTQDMSSSRRGGLRSHRGAGGPTKAQLYAEAARRGVRGRSTMTKAQLARAVGR